jgi:hypothetical protein
MRMPMSASAGFRRTWPPPAAIKDGDASLYNIVRHHVTFSMAITPSKKITIEPIAHGEGSAVDFGAVVSGVDIENLTGESLPGHGCRANNGALRDR